MATKPEDIGILAVHGIGEQNQLYHLKETARELAAHIARAPGVVRLSVSDETRAKEPRIVISLTIKDRPRSAARQLRLNLHEVWWADLGIRGGFLSQVRFWFWGLGQWGAEAVREGKRRSNTQQLMVMPCFPYQRSREERPPLLHRLPYHLLLFGAAMLAFLTFFTWSAAKRLIKFFSGRLPDPSLIFLFLGDVMIYERPARTGHGTMEDPELPVRTTIRRRMARGVTDMAARPYDGWYILAHSLGCVPAFNVLQETELALPNYLDEAHWKVLPAALKTSSPFVAEGATPTTDNMMPRRPPWLTKTDGISRVALFKNFRGLVTYGCPLDKFAALWPRIVCLNKQTAVFQMGCEWVNLHEPTDPVAARLDAFAAPPRDSAETPSDLVPLSPKNFACRALWVFLLSHIYYFSPKRRRTRLMGAAITDALLSPAQLSLSESAERARLSPGREGLRLLLATIQVVVLFAALLLAAGYLLILISNTLGCDSSACEILSEWSWTDLLRNAGYALLADLAIVFVAGLVRMATDAFRPRHGDKSPAP